MLEDSFFFDQPGAKSKTQAFLSSLLKHNTSREDLLESIRSFKSTHAEALSSIVTGLALMRAVQMNLKEVISCLVSEGVDINMWIQCRTVLHEAIKEDYLSMLEFLLSFPGIDKEAQKPFCKSPLMMAALGKPKASKMLLDAGCDINAVDRKGNTALHLLMYKKSGPQEDVFQCLELLLSHGADINLPCNAGLTCLHKAVNARHSKMVEWLILRNCDLNPQCHLSGSSARWSLIGEDPHKPVTPVFIALRRAYRELVEVLIACGCRFRQHSDMLVECQPYDLLYHGLKCHLMNVTSLQASCRTVIRNRLSRNIQSEVQRLGLPPSLQKFVLCHEELRALHTALTEDNHV